MLSTLVNLFNRLIRSIFGVISVVALVPWLASTLFEVNVIIPRELFLFTFVVALFVGLIRIYLQDIQSQSRPKSDFDITILSSDLVNLRLFDGHRWLMEDGTAQLVVKLNIQNTRSIGTVVNVEAKDIETDLSLNFNVSKLEFARHREGNNPFPISLQPGEWQTEARLELVLEFTLKPHEKIIPQITKASQFKLNLLATQPDSAAKPSEYLIDMPDIGARFEAHVVEQITNFLLHPMERHPNIAAADELVKYLRLLWKGDTKKQD